MKKIAVVFFSIIIFGVISLHADLTVNIPFDQDVIGPAYNDSTYLYVSEFFDVINEGITDDFTILVDYPEIPADWHMIWCHEYQGGGACHMVPWPWTFEFESGDTLKLDFTVTVNSTGSVDFYYKFTAASLADSVLLNFSYTTGVSVDDPHINNPVSVINSPNPFDEYTTISFTSLTNINTINQIAIYNIKGELVKSYELTPDMNSVTWNGTDESGSAMPNGVYFYSISLDGKIAKTNKLLLLK